ncbi:MAG TPA: PD-(D/E)XK nuclease superfamily protein [Polyangiaceae bacterium]|nr:PD-(D/E)XK nuclease superfamily protein [Polyangiaceae bacterium]
MTGNQYRRLVARYLLSAYGNRGLQVFEEINVGTSIIGKQRRADLFLHLPSTGAAMVLECKYQDSAGTVDEKIPYALQDLAALRMPGAVAYAGSGFSEGVLHLLQSAESAAYCFPDETLKPLARRPGSIDSGTWQLDHVLAMTFGWWDILLAGKSPLVLEVS